MAEIALEKVSKRFPDGTVAVHAADFTIRDGELFILVGPSGCGKSTLLHMIVGLEEVSEGTIRVGGRVVNELDPKDRNMAMVFQSYAIYPHMTVRENIAFPLKLARLDRREIDRRVERAAAALELGALLERKPASLSGGQRQRVAMGRAIVREPDAFLLDEPLSNLDAKLRVQMRAEIARTHKRLGTTTVYVTHDQTEAMTLGQRVAVLRKGEVQQIGTPRELYERPANLFVAGFIGSPAMNFLPARIEGERLRLPMAELELPRAVRERLAGTGDGLIAGIRPEHIRETAGTGTPGPTFSATVDVLEWLGADVYAYFAIEGASAADLRALPEELDIEPAKDGRLPLVARLEAGSLAAEGAALELALEPSRIHLFSARSGARLSS